MKFYFRRKEKEKVKIEIFGDSEKLDGLEMFVTEIPEVAPKSMDMQGITYTPGVYSKMVRIRPIAKGIERTEFQIPFEELDRFIETLKELR